MAKKEKEVKEKKTSYFKAMRAELKKVTWPTPKELFNNSVAVITFVVIIALIVFILDFCFDNINKHGITKIQEKVQSSFKVEEESSEESSDSENNNESTEGEENTDSTTEVEVKENSEEQTSNE